MPFGRTGPQAILATIKIPNGSDIFYVLATHDYDYQIENDKMGGGQLRCMSEVRNAWKISV
jgi:hypothetical protein